MQEETTNIRDMPNVFVHNSTKDEIVVSFNGRGGKSLTENIKVGGHVTENMAEKATVLIVHQGKSRLYSVKEDYLPIVFTGVSESCTEKKIHELSSALGMIEKASAKLRINPTELEKAKNHVMKALYVVGNYSSEDFEIVDIEE